MASLLSFEDAVISDGDPIAITVNTSLPNYLCPLPTRNIFIGPLRSPAVVAGDSYIPHTRGVLNAHPTSIAASNSLFNVFAGPSRVFVITTADSIVDSPEKPPSGCSILEISLITRSLNNVFVGF